MSETIRLGEIAITVTRKAVKHAHLSVYPPGGRVTLVAPMETRREVARAYAISKLGGSETGRSSCGFRRGSRDVRSSRVRVTICGGSATS